MDELLRIVNHVFPGEREFLAFVREHRHIGYGRMMQIIEREWYRVNQLEGNPVEGVLIVDTALGMVDQDRREVWADGYLSDPLFRADRRGNNE